MGAEMNELTRTGSRTLKGVLLAGSACVALFAAAPVAWSQVPPASFGTTTAAVVPLTGQTTVFLSDQAILSNFTNPTGTVNFILNGPPGTVGTSFQTVNGNGTYPSGNFLLPNSGPVAGQYTWTVTFGTLVATEATMVSAANPSLTTTTSLVGLTLTDSATLSLGYFPTGNIVFTLVGPDGVVDATDTVTVNGNATYTTPSGFTADLLGTYTWNAMYLPNGDPNNVQVSAMPESVTVGSSVPEPSTWAMMLIGFAGLGFAFRQSRRRVSFA
jgi:hypothetical protein